ncbi:hypothetical protein Hanom_Chr10g00961551 [Helianthus anomalus]
MFIWRLYFIFIRFYSVFWGCKLDLLCCIWLGYLCVFSWLGLLHLKLPKLSPHLPPPSSLCHTTATVAPHVWSFFGNLRLRLTLLWCIAFRSDSLTIWRCVPLMGWCDVYVLAIFSMFFLVWYLDVGACVF